jgi:hypothetical protein
MDLPISSPHSAGSDKVTWFDVCELVLLHPEDFRLGAQRDRLLLAIPPCDCQRSTIKLLYCTRDPGWRAICRALRKHRSSRKSDNDGGNRQSSHVPSPIIDADFIRQLVSSAHLICRTAVEYEHTDGAEPHWRLLGHAGERSRSIGGALEGSSAELTSTTVHTSGHRFRTRIEQSSGSFAGKPLI